MVTNSKMFDKASTTSVTKDVKTGSSVATALMRLFFFDFCKIKVPGRSVLRNQLRRSLFCAALLLPHLTTTTPR